MKCESENGKVGQENTDSIGLNIENDALGSGYFHSHPYAGQPASLQGPPAKKKNILSSPCRFLPFMMWA
jgi:hypothetical protein